MKYFLDTEFEEEVGSIGLISVALVCEDGREFYAVNSSFNPDLASEWIREHVVPKLPPQSTWISRKEIAERVLEFVGSRPEFWAYFADYDWVVFCWIFGRMVDLPSGWPKFCMDLKQGMVERGVSRAALPVMAPHLEHDALEDARWLMRAHAMVYAT